MVSVTNPVVAGIVGILLLGEGFRYGSLGALLALLAALVAARGVIGLAMRTPVRPPLDEILTLPDPGELPGDGPAAVAGEADAVIPHPLRRSAPLRSRRRPWRPAGHARSGAIPRAPVRVTPG